MKTQNLTIALILTGVAHLAHATEYKPIPTNRGFEAVTPGCRAVMKHDASIQSGVKQSLWSKTVYYLGSTSHGTKVYLHSYVELMNLTQKSIDLKEGDALVFKEIEPFVDKSGGYDFDDSVHLPKEVVSCQGEDGCTVLNASLQTPRGELIKLQGFALNFGSFKIPNVFKSIANVRLNVTLADKGHFVLECPISQNALN